VKRVIGRNGRPHSLGRLDEKKTPISFYYICNEEEEEEEQ
jgi:hypothetical protein